MTTRAIRDGDDYVVNGSKTFITNGIHADLVIVAAARPTRAAARGSRLLVLEAGRRGFARGRKLHKVGQHAARTPPSCSSTTCCVPAANLLGDEGAGLPTLMRPSCRRSACRSPSSRSPHAGRLEDDARVRQGAQGLRPADRPFQNSRFCSPRCAPARRRAGLRRPLHRTPTTTASSRAEDAAKAKWWSTEGQSAVIDRCLQLHGGYGYMRSTRSPGVATPAS